MKYLLVLLVALLVGCAQNSITVMDADGEPVTFKQRLGGRGCIAAVYEQGRLDILIQQDGSSDWATLRTIPILAQTVIATIMGKPPAEGESMKDPSNLRGCAGVFADDVEP